MLPNSLKIILHKNSSFNVGLK